MSEIKTTEELNTFADDTDERLRQLEKDNKDLVKRIQTVRMLQKENYKDFGTSDESKDAKFGQYMRALYLKQSGVPVTDSQLEMIKREVDEPHLRTKADLGTPLTSDATTGSYLTSIEYLRDIQAIAEQQSEIIPKMTKVQMSQRQMYVPVKSDGLSLTYMANDTSDSSEVNPTFSQETLTNYIYAGYVPFSENLLDDDITVIGGFFRRQIGETYQAKIESEILTGSGSPVTGLSDNTSVNDFTMDDNTIANIDVDDLYSTIEQLTTGAKRRGAMFVMHPLTWDRVRKLKDADGNPMVAPWQELERKALFGYPVALSDNMTSTDAASTTFAIFGNFRHTILGVRQALEMKLFSDTQYAVVNHEVFFRFRCRLAFLITHAAAFARLKTSA